MFQYAGQIVKKSKLTFLEHYKENSGWTSLSPKILQIWHICSLLSLVKYYIVMKSESGAIRPILKLYCLSKSCKNQNYV